MKKTILLAAALFSLTAANAQETTTLSFNSVADTWVRENNGSYDRAGGNATIETKREANVIKDADGNEVLDADGNKTYTYTYMAGLMGFEFNAPAGTRVKSAKLHLTTERVKVKKEVSIRAYGNDFDEGTSWNNEADYLAAALANEPVVTFVANGQNPKAVFDGGLTEEYQTIDAWKNELDVTSYIASLPLGTKRVNFLFTQDGDEARDQVCFYSKDNTGASGKDEYPGLQNLTYDQLKPVLEVEFVEDADINTDVLSPTADTWVYKGDKTNRAAGENLEIYYTVDEETGLRDKELYGLMSFTNLPAGLNTGKYLLESAVLRLTCVFLKSNRAMDIYEYSNAFSEGDVNFAIEEMYISSTFGNKPIASFEVNGQMNKAMFDGGISEQYQKVEAWQNYIDLTEYLKNKEDKSQLNMLFCKGVPVKEATKFGSKEAQDIVNEKDVENQNFFTFKGEDLRPQLTVIYSKNPEYVEPGVEPGGDDPENPGEDGVSVVKADSATEWYNLQGVRVAQPTEGLYIRVINGKAAKVMLRK